MNESYQIDENKFYHMNFKKIDKKSDKNKIELIPDLNFK